MPPSQNLNANGKRSWKDNGQSGQTQSSSGVGSSLMDILNDSGAGSSSSKAGKNNGPAQFHQDHSTGYTWQDEKDAPGYAWLNKQAREESQRAWNNIVDKDRVIKNRYGDVLLDRP
jgi:hypothetical protein